jgi:glycosyltransferase involved in cell wall biosynthesis
MKILVAAYAFDPLRGSEQAVGWGWATAIAHDHEVWVMCADWQRPSVESFIRRRREDFQNLHIVYIRPRAWHYTESHWFWRRCEASLLKPIMHMSYCLWQKDAYREAIQLHRKIGFDLVHQLTFVGFRFPGHLWKLGIPFIWGPIGGMENVPWHLLPCMGPSGLAQFTCRNIINRLHKRYLRAPKYAFRAAAHGGIIAATTSIQGEIKRHYGINAKRICEVGIPKSFIATTHARRSTEDPIILTWSGHHLSRKALPILLKALASLPPAVNWRLDIFGDGPCRPRWQALASTLGLQNRCTWFGNVSRAEAMAGLRQSHLFVITSLQDLTSTVAIEALANGVPVLCPAHCGFSDALTTDSGITLPINTVTEFHKQLTAKIVELYENEHARQRLAMGALRRARYFTWEEKRLAIDEVYRRVLNERMEQQSFQALAQGDMNSECQVVQCSLPSTNDATKQY